MNHLEPNEPRNLDALSPKVVIMAGGTGGHVYPGTSLALELASRGFKVEWLGTRLGLEAKLIPPLGIDIHFISIKGVRGTGLTNRLQAPLRLLWAGLQALKFLRHSKPQLVVGLGGFVSGPGAIAAWLLRIPLIIHEQNAIPGTTNLWLTRIAQKTLQGFEQTFAHGITTGNPVRPSIVALKPPIERFRGRHGPIRILILGGSRGALALNELLPKALTLLKAADDNFEVWHQTGGKKQAELIAHYTQAGIQARVDDFIETISQAYNWADLVICRSGALTVSELRVVGCAAILIPFPYAIDDHQTKNAQILTDLGAARILQEKDATPEKLKTLIFAWLDRSLLAGVAQLSQKARLENAIQRVASECIEVINEYK